MLNDSGFSWLYELLFAFNSGNIQRFEEIFSSQSNTQAVLLNNVTVLHRKIRILALMELVFQRPSIDRTLSFPTISQACQLPLSDVELLVMKALSLGVIRGQIDQVEGSVRVHWVQPRVLDTNQIRQVGAKVQQWISNVRDTTDFLEKSGPEIFHSVSAP